jgi:hypothetical protein
MCGLRCAVQRSFQGCRGQKGRCRGETASEKCERERGRSLGEKMKHEGVKVREDIVVEV